MFKNYFTTAWRHLIKHKVFSFINIFGLALSLTAVWLIALFVADEVSFDRYHKTLLNIITLIRTLPHNTGVNKNRDKYCWRLPSSLLLLPVWACLD
ncbi:hypothetical protein A3860_35860 [Niastella vici]|uniref:MacB-like periplasmic core domain-containing protein n=1 Tax=Niastella vici TaxID=1703345 RepID=A0A1V9FNH6_9BACT|nr:hypothetical protein A3860_35860 [Niastella vici]